MKNLQSDIMEVWNTLYTDEKYGIERKSSFNYFQRYLKQNHPRKITVLYDEICAEISKKNNINCPKDCDEFCINKNHDYCPKNFNPKKPIKIETLYDYSRKWKWKKREKKYDEYLLKLHFHNKEMGIIDWENEQLKFAKNRCNFHNDSLSKIHELNDNDVIVDGIVLKNGVSIEDKIKMEKINQEAYDKSLEDVYKLLYGGIIKQDNTINSNMDIKNTVSYAKTVKDTVKEYEDYFEEFEQELEENINNNSIDE